MNIKILIIILTITVILFLSVSLLLFNYKPSQLSLSQYYQQPFLTRQEQRTLQDDYDVDTNLQDYNLTRTLQEDYDLALARALHESQQPQPQPRPQPQQSQLSQNYDLALARALHESQLQPQPQPLRPQPQQSQLSQEDYDLALARALHESQLQPQPQPLRPQPQPLRPQPQPLRPQPQPLRPQPQPLRPQPQPLRPRPQPQPLRPRPQPQPQSLRPRQARRYRAEHSGDFITPEIVKKEDVDVTSFSNELNTIREIIRDNNDIVFVRAHEDLQIYSMFTPKDHNNLYIYYNENTINFMTYRMNTNTYYYISNESFVIRNTSHDDLGHEVTIFGSIFTIIITIDRIILEKNK